MIDYEFYGDSNVTTCVLWVTDGENTAEYVGSARRDPHDRHNRDIGEGLALARALDKASRSIARYVNGKVKQADHTAQQKLLRQAKDPDGSLARRAREKYGTQSDYEKVLAAVSENEADEHLMSLQSLWGEAARVMAKEDIQREKMLLGEEGPCPANVWDPNLGPCLCAGRVHNEDNDHGDR